jgi:hypothetical protein
MEKNSTGLELFVMSNPDSMMWVIEILRYFFMGLSTLFAVPVFGSSLLESSIKLIFILNGLLGIGGLIGYAEGLSINILIVGLMFWNVIMPVAALLLIFYFRKFVNTTQQI